MCAVGVFAVWMLSVTGVIALPAAIVAGEKVAVEPVGRPVTENVIGSRKVVAPAGASVRLKLATEPGDTLSPEAEPVTVVRVKGRPTMKLVVATAAA